MALDQPGEWSIAPIVDLIGPNGLISDGDWIESKDQDPDGSVRLIQLADIGDGEFKDKSARFMTPERAAALKCTYLEPHDVLVARMPDPLGRACIFPGVAQDAVTVVDVCLVRAGEKSGIENKLLMFWLNSPAVRAEIEGNASGTTRKRITRKKLELIELPVPPLAEQKAIADKLHTLLAQVETTRARLERIPDILKRFRQSVLGAAVSGRLTAHIRETLDCAFLPIGEESLKVPTSWARAKLIEVIDTDRKLCYGVVQPGEEAVEGASLIRVCDVNDGRIDWPNLRTISLEVDEQYRRSRVKRGDVLITIVGAIGRVAVVSEDKVANIARAVARVAPKDDMVRSEYLLYWLSSPSMQWWLVNSSKEVARKTLNLKELQEAPVPLPPMEEQTEIVRRVDQLFAHADCIEQQAQAALERVNKLTQSILAKAFRGELTEQWRRDHPELISGENSAAALLERIKAERGSNTRTKGRKSKA